MPGSTRTQHPSITFLVFAHRNGDQVARLLRRLRADLPDAAIVLRPDSRTLDMSAVLASDPGQVHLHDDGKRTDWGDWSIVETVMDTLAWSLAHLDSEWTVCLSGQDYPVGHLGRLQAMLGASDLDGYLSCWPVEDYPYWNPFEKIHRYHHRYYVIPNHIGPLSLRAPIVQRQVLRAIRVGNWVARSPDHFLFQGFPRGLPARVGVRRLRTPFTDEYRCLVGRQWWALRRPTAELLLDRYRHDRRVRDHFRRTLVPDESYFHTVLGNRSDVHLGDDLHHQDWTREERPHTFRSAELEEIVQSGKYFVRKVDTDVDARLLDLLDEHARDPST